MNIYRITPKAKQDLKDIGRYTMKIWGKKQQKIYLHAMENRFIWLAQYPNKGRHRPDIHDKYYSYLQGMHVIFYLIHDDGIDIIGILHQRMDITNHLFKRK